MKLRGNVNKGFLNTIFFAELNLIRSFSIYESFHKKWRVQPCPIKLTQSLLNQLKWNVFHNPAYSQDLAPSGYHLILNLKCDSGGGHFAEEEDLQSVVTEFFAKQDAEWYCTGIHKLISLYNKYLYEQGGDPGQGGAVSVGPIWHACIAIRPA